MNLIYRFIARYYTKRARRALRISRRFEKKAEKFFQKIKGIW